MPPPLPSPSAKSRVPIAALLALLVSCGGAEDSQHPGIALADRVAPGSAESTVCAGPTTLRGVDVSHYEGTIDWTKVAGSGRAFGIAKATEGLTFTDSTFLTNWSAIKASGLVRGAYHFFHPTDSGRSQADFFLSVSGSFGPGDLPPILDWEVTDSQPSSTSIREVQAFIDEIHARTGLTTIIYSSARVFSLVGNPAQFSGYPLWDAQWGVSCPNLPPGFTTWAFWQDADNGTVPGIPVAVDTNFFNGTLAQLHALAGGSPGGTDAGTSDAGTADAGSHDAGTPDAGTPDAGTPDAGTPDAGSADAGSYDAGAPDAGSADAGTHDAGSDAGSADAGGADAGPDGGGHDAGAADAGGAGGHDAGTDAGSGDRSDGGSGLTIAPAGGCGTAAGATGGVMEVLLLLLTAARGRRRERRR